MRSCFASFLGVWLVAALVSPPTLADAPIDSARAKHWSFQPIAPPPGGHSIDGFIREALEEHGLALSPPAERRAWLRRVTFDLTGLPPTPEEVEGFLADASPDAFERVVDRLLASPHYGERWAQHWLDVVRYADTHGFEVNTERPNAWPYRDYVIRALNADTPYDRFIQEQIVGDLLGEDAATGFLVTASALLPGQIGKDAPSIRLARQDSLDEIVNNVSQTFLGLSIGCARCHDHKFDPVTAKDYYAMQSFVAGVEYDDREIQDAESAARRKESEPLRRDLDDITSRLAQFAPYAKPESRPRATDPRENIEAFEPVEAKFVRFTIHDANLHPSLGLIEPCVDEFEIHAEGENLARRAKVTASGSVVSDAHKLEHINDGQYGNARSWMSDAKGRGWVQFELPEPARISKVVWGRDREGVFTDRLATAYTLEAGFDPGSLAIVAEVAPQRPAAGAGPVNTDRFKPTRTRILRFTILATNSLEPCLDEIEVFNAAGENVALASSGAKATTSGDILVPNRHDPGFINDGHYGNERSWLSNGPGRGWVELEFAAEQEVTRVLWSRDREGKFLDRLPVEYKIELFTEGEWRLVADSSDRRPHIAGMSLGPAQTLAGLPPGEAREAERLLKLKGPLERRIAALEAGRMVFGGKFRSPDEIRLLGRGDPEQPKEVVAPAMPAVFGEMRLPTTTPERERRRALAAWIASPNNPLTARVMANRIWQWHFGVGLVDTPSDFGLAGSKPTHPRLLDWLAAELIRGGWSLKHLHRLITLSETYRQSSRHDPAAAAKDADVRLLWRFPTRRLEAESIRDSMLFVSGRLDHRMHGRGYDLFNQRGGLSGFKPVESFSGDGLRRMIYAHKVRREPEAVFGAFDCPDAGQSAAIRRATTTPIQALNLLNSRFTLDEAAAFAARVGREAGPDLGAQVVRAHQLALNREPTPAELLDSESVAREHGLATLCRALYNCNEFLFPP